jgi:hypothetical protein
MLLVYMEIEFHYADLSPHIERHQEGRQRDYAEDPELERTPGPLLSTSTWEQVRPRISQLLPANRFAELAQYYKNIQGLNDLLGEHTSPIDRVDRLGSQAVYVAKDCERVWKWIREEYIGRMDADLDPTVPEK